jgi:hypothetical protein
VDSEFVGNSLRSDKSPGGAAILGNAVIDDGHVRSLASRLAIGIFTDSFIKVMGTLYQFRPGDGRRQLLLPLTTIILTAHCLA